MQGKWLVRSAVVVGLLGMADAAEASPTCTTSSGTVTCTYSAVGSDRFTVPAGVHQVTFDAYGAQGGNSNGPAGGRGGRATASMTVQPQDIYTIVVGGAGSRILSNNVAAGPGGYNGGADGGPGYAPLGGSGGAGGGGASDVRSGSGTLADRILVAGGGGGSASTASRTYNANGGGGGGLTGENGWDVFLGPGFGGAAGGQTADTGSGTPGNGSAGAAGQKGTGGSLYSVGGGGGGGGYFGGAGGDPNQGGGGGSGYGPDGTVFQTGVRSGNGLVVVSYQNADRDGDGIDDAADNCPDVANGGQADLDGDKVGDACDPDVDGDTVPNEQDAFPRDPLEYADTDKDGVGDNADAFPNNPAETKDSDADGIGDNADNCRDDANAGQADLDGDKVGDACDPDVDGDGYANEQDKFPFDKSEHADNDNDGVGDNADAFPYDATEMTDTDKDGVGDKRDNCRTVANAGQADLDGDGLGDACDNDRDGDGVPNASDNAPDNANADQEDLDKDGIGDVIDPTVLPLAEDDCKRGGYVRFYDGTKTFRNQGDCVSYVATKNRNYLH